MALAMFADIVLTTEKAVIEVGSEQRSRNFSLATRLRPLEE
jgi:hypothetical protein